MLKEWNDWKKCIEENKTPEKCKEYYTIYLKSKPYTDPISER